MEGPSASSSLLAAPPFSLDPEHQNTSPLPLPSTHPPPHTHTLPASRRYNGTLVSIPAARNRPQLTAAMRPGALKGPLFAPADPTWQKLQMVATLCNNSRFIVQEKEDEPGKTAKPPLDLVGGWVGGWAGGWVGGRAGGWWVAAPAWLAAGHDCRCRWALRTWSPHSDAHGRAARARSLTFQIRPQTYQPLFTIATEGTFQTTEGTATALTCTAPYCRPRRCRTPTSTCWAWTAPVTPQVRSLPAARRSAGPLPAGGGPHREGLLVPADCDAR